MQPRSDTQRAAAVVDPKRFLQATRDSGYRDLGSAIAELVDNSLQAGAANVDVFLPQRRTDEPPSIAVLDDGTGMTRKELASALQFGGSTRFDDREGMGRYGMGLPNSSLSQARRADVYTWRDRRVVWHAYLDLDELLQAPDPRLPLPKRAKLPKQYKAAWGTSGTLVVWRKLDRYARGYWGPRRKAVDRLLGQRFRYFFWGGRAIRINGEPVLPFDPLYLSRETRTPEVCAQAFGDVLGYDIRVPDEKGQSQCSAVEVRFSEIPVHELADKPNDFKRAVGIAKGAGVSVVRAEREIDYRWVFFDKRRENYDDWWRCEIRFSPELDEMFGVSHTKQGISPSRELRQMMSGELSAIARTLNARARASHMALGARRAEGAAASIAADKDTLLRPLDPGQARTRKSVNLGATQYRISAREIEEPVFYRTEARQNQVTVVLNSLHEFHDSIYGPLLRDGALPAGDLRVRMELLLLALGRSELLCRKKDGAAVRRFVREWSRAISVFCRGR